MSALSWRDVYDAVQESEQSVLTEVRTLNHNVMKIIEDHERRLRVIEISDAQNNGHGTGIRDTIGGARTVIALLVSLASFGIAVAAAFS